MWNETRNYFCIVSKNQGLHVSAAYISSGNSKSTNHISLTETDHCHSELSKNIMLEENLQENQREICISDIV